MRVPDVVGLPLRVGAAPGPAGGLRASAVLWGDYEEKDMVLEQRPQRGQMVYASEDNESVGCRATATSSGCRRSTSAATPPAATSCAASPMDHPAPVRFHRADAGEHPPVLRLLRDPEHFLPWFAGWSAMVLEPDWPVNKKRRLIKRRWSFTACAARCAASKLFISLFTGF